MPHDPSFEPFRRFYREGGYVDEPEPMNERKRLEMALYGSQQFAEGGRVMPPYMLAYGSQYFKDGGVVIEDILAALSKLRGMK